jgi:hypothetical protein
MNPESIAGKTATTTMQITYLKNVLYLMIAEDLKRPNEATAQASDTKVVRRLTVISDLFLNLRSLSLKNLQESRIAAMA